MEILVAPLHRLAIIAPMPVVPITSNIMGEMTTMIT